jgi:hypothetical protein
MIYAIGLLIAFVLVILLANRETRLCRWRARAGAEEPGAQLYRCAACGAEATTDTGKPPKLCLARPSP